MGEFASELRRRVVAAEHALLQARVQGDEYGQSVLEGDLAALQRLADDHRVAVPRTLDLTRHERAVHRA
ncbi:hypothetical protein [Vallicoccus soli]|uniref:Uncharacterized protein n=1 Tax=Vallicoccus soli TaxID=2339232 RepID=A0A3A3ZA69_9ACTN|nr:hypothetical protein [Vallicoccus soli]RJK97986.1 hypothetical protein D5H78_03240 [Vallicoccus soli]